MSNPSSLMHLKQLIFPLAEEISNPFIDFTGVNVNDNKVIKSKDSNIFICFVFLYILFLLKFNMSIIIVLSNYILLLLILKI